MNIKYIVRLSKREWLQVKTTINTLAAFAPPVRCGRTSPRTV